MESWVNYRPLERKERLLIDENCSDWRQESLGLNYYGPCFFVVYINDFYINVGATIKKVCC